MKTRSAVIGLLLFVILLGAAFFWWAVAPDPLENLAKEVQKGMVDRDVEAILNKPDFTSKFPDDGAIMHKWVTDRVIVVVVFDPEGRVEKTVVHRRPLWDRIQEFRK
jgi:HAMP domain-containing protein